MPSDNPTEKICWTERFYIKTSIQDRNLNETRPYEAIYDDATLELNAELNRKIEQVTTYLVHLIVGKENVLEDIARARRDPDWKLFGLNFDEGHFVPIYQQPYHGAVNLKTGQFVFYVFHPEPILRGGFTDNFLHLADMTMNLYADLLNITTVRPNAFVKFSTSNITDSSLWKSDNQNGKQKNVLKAVIMMRWVEKNHDYRFSISQLSQAIIAYADREDLDLDDDADDSPLRQLNLHMVNKSNERRRAIGFPNLVKGREVHGSMGYPGLAKGRATQAAAGYPNLVKALEVRRANKLAKQQAEGEDPNKLKCPECGLQYKKGDLKRHRRCVHKVAEQDL